MANRNTLEDWFNSNHHWNENPCMGQRSIVCSHWSWNLGMRKIYPTIQWNKNRGELVFTSSKCMICWTAWFVLLQAFQLGKKNHGQGNQEMVEEETFKRMICPASNISVQKKKHGLKQLAKWSDWHLNPYVCRHIPPQNSTERRHTLIQGKRQKKMLLVNAHTFVSQTSTEGKTAKKNCSCAVLFFLGKEIQKPQKF